MSSNAAYGNHQITAVGGGALELRARNGAIVIGINITIIIIFFKFAPVDMVLSFAL